MTPGVPLVEVTRRDRGSGDVVESVHSGHLVVVGPDTEVVALAGDPGTVVFARSAVKPIQATACLELLTPEDRPSGEELAVGWASHRGEPAHLAAVERLLARSETPSEALTCPPATSPTDPRAQPTRLQHNCSGKHALFALAGTAVGCAGPALLDPDGPLQRVVLEALADTLGDAVHLGVDGCGAPAVAVPLVDLAAGVLAVTEQERFAAVRAAGFEAPVLVGGTDTAESALLGAGVVAKPGAEGVFVAGWRGGRGPVALAVKVSDGAGRAAAAVAVAAAVAAGAAPADVWSPPQPLGGGAPQGAVRPTAELRAVLAGLAA